MAFPWFGKQKISIDLSRKKGGRSFVAVLRPLASAVVLLVLVGALFIAFHFYTQYTRLARTTPATPGSVADPIQSAIAAVDKHLLLPQGEQPVIAKVSDLAPLAVYPFFRNATVGDEVLVYCKAQLSVLYSPGRDKVIEVAREALAGACTKGTN